jgi:TolA-binding protein
MNALDVKRIGRTIALAGALALAAGCGPTQSDLQQLNNNQFATRGLIASNQQEIDALKQRVSQLQDQVDELLHGGGGGGGRGNKLLAARISKLESEVSALQAGATGMPPGAPAVPGTAASPGAAPESGGAATGTPPAAPGETPPPEFATGTPPATETGGEEAGAPETPPSAEAADWRASIDREIASAQTSGDPGTALYLKGLQQMKAGQYQDAAARFATMMRRFPKSPLSEPAEYFSANALYEMNKYDQAILQFNDLAMRFPKGRFTCAALLREGQAFMQINDRIDARLTLQKLINDHRECPESSVASAMMRNLASN